MKKPPSSDNWVTAFPERHSILSTANFCRLKIAIMLGNGALFRLSPNFRRPRIKRISALP